VPRVENGRVLAVAISKKKDDRDNQVAALRILESRPANPEKGAAPQWELTIAGHRFPTNGKREEADKKPSAAALACKHAHSFTVESA
jgi:hypothetical protein